jgi:hypothetical protein
LIEITVHCGSRRRPCRRPKQSMAIAELGQNEPTLLVAHGFAFDLVARSVRERLAAATPRPHVCRRQSNRSNKVADH